jgi:hypothetical protein
VPVPVVPVLLLELEPVPVVVSVVLEDEPDVAPGVVVGAGVVTEPEPEVDPLAPGVVVVLGGEAEGVLSAPGVSVVRVVPDSVHAVMVRPSARAQKPVTNLFMVVSSLGGSCRPGWEIATAVPATRLTGCESFTTTAGATWKAYRKGAENEARRLT